MKYRLPLMVGACLVLALVAGACAVTAPVAPTPANTEVVPMFTAGPVDPEAPNVMVTGTIENMTPGGHLIEFKEMAEGLNKVILNDKTKIAFADGQDGTLADLQPEVVITAAGCPDGKGAVVAQKVTIQDK